MEIEKGITKKVEKIFTECVLETLDKTDKKNSAENSVLFFICGKNDEGKMESMFYAQFAVMKGKDVSTQTEIIDSLQNYCDMKSIIDKNLSFAEKCVFNGMKIDIEGKLTEATINFCKEFAEVKGFSLGDFLLMFRRSEKYGLVVRPFFVQNEKRSFSDADELNQSAKNIKMEQFVKTAMDKTSFF